SRTATAGAVPGGTRGASVVRRGRRAEISTRADMPAPRLFRRGGSRLSCRRHHVFGTRGSARARKMPLLTPPSPRPAAAARYRLASLSTLVVLGVAVAQRDVGHEEILLLVPSAITAWYGGIGPAILASLLSTLALDYFFVPPLYSWSL